MLVELNNYGAFFMQGLEMAGKSNKGKNRKAQNATTEHKVSSDAPVSDCVSSEANGNAELSVSADTKSEMKESSNGVPENQSKQGEVTGCLIFPCLLH